MMQDQLQQGDDVGSQACKIKIRNDRVLLAGTRISTRRYLPYPAKSQPSPRNDPRQIALRQDR